MKTVGLSFIALRAMAEGRLPTSLSLLFFEKLYSTFVVIVGGLVATVPVVTVVIENRTHYFSNNSGQYTLVVG